MRPADLSNWNMQQNNLPGRIPLRVSEDFPRATRTRHRTSLRPTHRAAGHDDEAVASFYAALAEHERRLLGLLMRYPRMSAPIVAAAGLDAAHFSQDDHRLIFAGWAVERECGLSRVVTLRNIRQALQVECLWDDEAPAHSTGMRHSDLTLLRLSAGWVPDEERADIAGHGTGDGLRRAIARHVVDLVDAVNEMGRVAA